VEAEAPAVEAEAPAGALLDGAGGPGSGGWDGGGRGGAGLGVVEDGALLDWAPAGASKRKPEDWHRRGRGGGRGAAARAEVGGLRAVHASGGRGVGVLVRRAGSERQRRAPGSWRCGSKSSEREREARCVTFFF
jgi:hypothetical protein